MNTFGQLFRLSSFGESHGRGIGGVLDGCPPGLTVDLELIRKELSRRRPGQSALSTERNEADEVELISDRIKAGDQLVVLGQARLRDGVKLKVIE